MRQQSARAGATSIPMPIKAKHDPRRSSVTSRVGLAALLIVNR